MKIYLMPARMKNTTPEIYTLKSAILEKLEPDILLVITSADYETQVEDVEEIHKISKRIFQNKPHYILVLTQQGASATHEARERAKELSKKRNIVAEAIVIENVAIRMAATVYMKINRPKQKIKLFNSKESALAWIEKLRKA